MTSVGDKGKLIRTRDGTLCFTPSGIPSVGDKVALIRGRDGSFMAHRSGPPSVGDQVLLSRDMYGNPIAIRQGGEEEVNHFGPFVGYRTDATDVVVGTTQDVFGDIVVLHENACPFDEFYTGLKIYVSGFTGSAFIPILSYDGETKYAQVDRVLNAEVTGTVVSATETTITFSSDLSSETDYYKDFKIRISGGTGLGQIKTITGYDGPTRTATVDSAWETIPDSSSTFHIWDPDTVYTVSYRITERTGQTETSGTAQGGYQSGVTFGIYLAADASSVDNYYYGMQIEIVSGTCSGQVRTLLFYDGSTKRAIIDGFWDGYVLPDTSSGYVITTYDNNNALEYYNRNLTTVGRIKIDWRWFDEEKTSKIKSITMVDSTFKYSGELTITYPDITDPLNDTKRMSRVVNTYSFVGSIEGYTKLQLITIDGVGNLISVKEIPDFVDHTFVSSDFIRSTYWKYSSTAGWHSSTPERMFSKKLDWYTYCDLTKYLYKTPSSSIKYEHIPFYETVDGEFFYLIYPSETVGSKKFSICNRVTTNSKYSIILLKDAPIATLGTPYCEGSREGYICAKRIEVDEAIDTDAWFLIARTGFVGRNIWLCPDQDASSADFATSTYHDTLAEPYEHEESGGDSNACGSSTGFAALAAYAETRKNLKKWYGNSVLQTFAEIPTDKGGYDNSFRVYSPYAGYPCFPITGDYRLLSPAEVGTYDGKSQVYSSLLLSSSLYGAAANRQPAYFAQTCWAVYHKDEWDNSYLQNLKTGATTVIPGHLLSNSEYYDPDFEQSYLFSTVSRYVTKDESVIFSEGPYLSPLSGNLTHGVTRLRETLDDPDDWDDMPFENLRRLIDIRYLSEEDTWLAYPYQGMIDCSSNPDYPSAHRCYTYYVSVSGKIGGESGVEVSAGDLVTCYFDSTPSGDHATVGDKWAVHTPS